MDQFAFHHVLRELDQNIENLEVAFGEGHLERLHVQPVARQHAAVIAPAGIRRGTSAARIGAVDHVIVDQRGAVNQFNDGAQADRAIARYPA